MANKNQQQDFSSILLSPDEVMLCALGSSFAQSFFATGRINKGFAILSNKRVYFKGKAFIKKNNRYQIQKEERTVDIKDITGTGFVYDKYLFLIGLALVCFSAALLQILYESLSGAIVSIVLGLVFLLLYKKLKKNIFQISFAGGSIGFNTYWATQEEIKNFQKKLRETKDAIGTQNNEPTFSSTNKFDELKHYKELLDLNIITPEEFEKKKNSLINL